MMKGGTWIGPEEVRQFRKKYFRELVKKHILLFSLIPFCFVVIETLAFFSAITTGVFWFGCLAVLVFSYGFFFLRMASISRNITAANAEEYIDDI